MPAEMGADYLPQLSLNEKVTMEVRHSFP